jgi:hypothetical protein
MSVSTALRGRISLYREEGKSIVATIRPPTILPIFETPQLQQLADAIESSVIKVMNDTATAS